MKVTELTEEQLEKIFNTQSYKERYWLGINNTKWMIINHPEWMFHNFTIELVNTRPEWVAKHYPEWMISNHPRWMINNRGTWVADNYPEYLQIHIDEVPEDILKLLL